MLSLDQVRRLKEVLRATSAPLSFESFSDFARAVLTPLIDLVGGHGENLFITEVKASQKPVFLWHTYDPELVGQYQGRFFDESPAHELKIAPETVKHHLKNIFEKTGVSRRSQLAALLPEIPRKGD